MPSEITISSFSTSDSGVTLPCTSTSYDAIADFIMQLKTIDCVDNAYVASISKSEDESGQLTYTFSVSVNYVPMMQDPAAEDTSADGQTENVEEDSTEAE